MKKSNSEKDNSSYKKFLEEGTTKFYQNDFIGAIDALNKAIKLKPKEDSIYFRKATILMDLNKPKQAKLSIKKGLLINKNNEKGYFQLGNAEIMLNNYNSALIAFKKSSRINSNFWQSINNEGLRVVLLSSLLCKS